MVLALIVVFSCVGSAGAVILSGIFLLFPEKIRERIIPGLVSYATGTLLGASFLALVPEALESAPAGRVLPVLLVGIVLFFTLEKFLLWRHCHEDHCDAHRAAGSLILIGDAFHNFVDGVIITASFVNSIELGIVTSLAVVSHEIPQEAGDFGILLAAGYTRGKAFLYNLLSGMATILGSIMAYFLLGYVRMAVPYIMALSASSFLYIAMVDLFPGLHRHTSLSSGLRQLALMLAGVGTIVLVHHAH